MPHIKYAPSAVRDLQRLQTFLQGKSRAAAKRASDTIIKGIQLLSQQPLIGRPLVDIPNDYREWIINFGDSGYIIKYHLNVDTLTVLSIRHQKERDYTANND